MHPFEEYLQRHNLEGITVSMKAQVRYLTVWNATKGNPITFEQAQKIRQAVITLTGVPYTGSLVLTQVRPVEQIKVFPIKTIKRSH